MKKIIICLVLFLNIFSCSEPEKDFKSFYINNSKDFESLLGYLEKKYVDEIDYVDDVRVVLYNCDKDQKALPVEICDENITEIMGDLKIKEISIEKEPCEHDKNTKNFGRIYFKIDKSEYYPITYYIYDYCAEQYAYESQTILHVTISGNWSYLKDSNFP